MAIQHMDNFSVYGTNKALLLNGVYAEATQPFEELSLVADPDGISGGHVISFHVSNANTPVLRYVLSASETTVGCAARFWMSELPGDNSRRPYLITFRDGANVEYVHLLVETTGRLTAGGDFADITTTAPVVSANGWYHIEVKYQTSGAGYIEVRVEGVTVISQALGYSSHGAVYQLSTLFFGTNFDDTLLYMKDYIIWDGTGTENNDFLGSVLVVGMTPVSDVALNWTPSTGANGYSILDNVPPDDTQYLTAPNPPPAAYTCEVSDLPPDVTSVKGIMSFVRAAKTDGGDASLQIGVISDPHGTPATMLGADRPITVAQTYWRDVFETDPKTSAPWLPAAVNAINLQMNRTT